ncbi:MAG: hypothetical protein KDH99_05080 [Alcanivoracaceae bacterium]|nr:hypothetical protein [Alcanivoracaceae bacterium]
MEQLDFVAPQDNPTPRTSRRQARPARARASYNGQSTGKGPREGYRRLTADIPADLHKRLKMQALMEERTVTDIILDATRAYLSNR